MMVITLHKVIMHLNKKHYMQFLAVESYLVNTSDSSCDFIAKKPCDLPTDTMHLNANAKKNICNHLTIWIIRLINKKDYKNELTLYPLVRSCLIHLK